MARFYPGMRVRIKYSRNWPELDGLTGTIIGKPPVNAHAMDGGKGDWMVQPDGFESCRIPHAESPTGTAGFCPYEDQLEPLTDSNELVSWESMRDLWVPDHLRVKA